ncbi:protein kinase family protein [Streptomyces sp. NPDC004732]|uniref:protein kinase family protein n=1 Tax=Streptomyces sp. NPDC004732 TaxID=3154290 RepID=UPI0033A64B7A
MRERGDSSSPNAGSDAGSDAETEPALHPGERLAAYSNVSTALSLLSDQQLHGLVDSAEPLGVGIGGSSALLKVAGVPVFAKRVPVTARELRPDHVRSTANVFDLPAFCQYGVGGPGFGVWREVAAHTMTTNWVLTGQHHAFPLMYHWRVLPAASATSSVPGGPGGPGGPSAGQDLPDELADVERAVAYWGGGPAVRNRIEALKEASASLVLFLEYVPRTLHEWLAEQVRIGGRAADRACRLVEQELVSGTSFMNDRGLLHFDAHFQNILTDGHRLYFSDFGLALSSRFDLSPEEADFFDEHRTYDRAYTLSYLVNALISALYGYERAEREALIRACADGAPPPAGPAEARAIIARYAPLAAVVTEFYGRLLEESREIPYPREAVHRILGP